MAGILNSHWGKANIDISMIIFVFSNMTLTSTFTTRCMRIVKSQRDIKKGYNVLIY